MSPFREDLSAKTLTGLERDSDAERSSAPERLSLVLIGGGGSGIVTTHTLPDAGEAVIGRAAACEVQVHDPSISRRHALLRIGSTLTIEDLGSANGTKVRGALLKPSLPTPIAYDEVVELGSVMMIAQRRAVAPRPLRLWNHDYFSGRLDEELVRAERTRQTFALLRVHLSPTVPAGALQTCFASALRPLDVAAIHAPGEYEVLLCDTSPDDAAQVAQRVVRELEAADIKVTVGVACWPRDGHLVDALVARASSLARGEDPSPPGASGPIVVSPGAMQQLRRLVERIAAGMISVLVLGETGVGKEVLAETVHRLSPRSSKPFLRLNCAALSESLLESELFGHERGSFTGAVQSKRGLLETASGGTVFLDEVGELPHSIQVKLLRVIEERQVLPVGALKSRPIDVRFVAATNRDLEAEIARGTFRQDLFFRLNGVTLVIPPLRERLNEIPDLARNFVRQSCAQAGRSDEPQLTAETIMLLRQYSWPGNIRELRNVIERAVLLCTGDRITREHLPVEKLRAAVPMSPRFDPPEAANAPSTSRLRERTSTGPLPSTAPLRERARTARVTAMTEADAVDVLSQSGLLATPPAGIREELSSIERQRIIEALQLCAGNQTQAAKLLGMSRRTLIARLDAYGIARPRKGTR